MKIGILTLPLVDNYGGVLQAYALSTYMKSIGHEPIELNRVANLQPLWKRVAHSFLDSILPGVTSAATAARHTRNIRAFIDTHIRHTEPIVSHSMMKDVFLREKCEALVIGSDQVWRAEYAMKYGYEYFGDFVPSGVRKIAYAASFGLSEWAYTQSQTEQIINYLKQFDAISVREKNAVSLCRDHLGMEAQHVLDPTMLLSADDYDRIASPRLIDEDYIFVYWLGERKTMLSVADEINKVYRLKIVAVNLRDRNVKISIEDWLSYIKHASLVVTDSFHGCVFSVLYHRQFRIYMNQSGGTGRLSSLFEQLGLSAEMVNTDTIDYGLVDAALTRERQTSTSFLSTVGRCTPSGFKPSLRFAPEKKMK